MPSTDLTEGLPWWTRQGVAPPSGTPTPPGARGMGSWYDYLASMFNPIGSAQADTLTQNQQLNGALAAQAGGASQPQPGDIPIQPNTIPERPSPPSGVGPPPQPAFNPLAGGSANTGLPFVNPNAPAPDASPAAAPRGPLAGGGAGGVGATSNPRFVQVDRPNMPAGGSGMARGGPPQMTALNLAGLFGGGQGANSANLPTRDAQTVSGPLAAGRSKAPWSMGPLQKGKVWPEDMGPFTQDQVAARGLRQRYR